ncbi:MAG TPA: serine/threonine-protein kinase, partial [Polyangia bacterium]|nr:serine/threonine-protein kinase [Polyangia bacterium]
MAGRLPDARRELVERHLTTCTLCTRLVSAATGSARETVRAPSQSSGSLSKSDELVVRERQPSLTPGTLLAETYRIIRLIGSGGMGEVYEASHTRLTGRYAVKVLHHHWAGDPRAIVRFGREAQITSGLRHPNIVAIIDFDYTPSGAPYLVMEYIEGVELATVIAGQAPMASDRVVRIVDQIASALTAVHARNIVHRDLKPQNIFLVPGERPGDERVKLVDFGISKVRAASVALTGERAVLGTPQYMAPEQAQAAGEVDGRADQFALAAIVYEMLTARMAFPGDRVEIVVYRISHEEPKPLGPAWGPGLASVIMRALAKDPARRFATTDEFAAA